ncbi:adenylate/guanylate cyclase domain-containing protein [Paraflavitalea speifideaquila]|uniref:adenylate/guanylate cyclase domain-containing protein n=1 Tax=Paraflavitalea speifideaquila TaxID=3076558 RepID=UPI0028F0A498|nr:adenylate/guanylate cyclase domain-containing protein [Paraflavitalea speifideiaquila]
MNRGTQLKFKQLLVIVIAWMLMGLLMTVYDLLVLLTDNTLGLSDKYSFTISATRNIGAGLVGALIGGSLLVFYVNVKYQDKPYGYTIFIVCISLLLIVAFISVLMGVILVPMRTGKSLTDPVSWAAFQKFLKDSSHIKATIFWGFVVGITQLLLQVNRKFGQGDFWNIIMGRYNTPKEEKRIFMFLDLNASTTIAEQLGNETYHALLKDFFADITAPILENKGNIYQYVGDEVVIAWNYEDGKENLQCIRCFFDMKLHIQKLQGKYLQRYGLVPTFKAGMHCGRVIAGEVGIIKRDITYSGDVLHTTSRILDKCGDLNEEVIASSDLLSELYSVRNYIIRSLGAIKLKGKEKEVMLVALKPA